MTSAPTVAVVLPAPRQAQREKLILLALLYVAQAIPLGFFTVALPAILRQRGVGLAQIGLVGALALPWLLKFTWAPLLDRFGSTRHGHFRSWIVPLQSLSALMVAVLALLDPTEQLPAILVVGGLFMLLAATQDIATDGLAVHNLSPDERGPANGLQVGGYYLGLILGGGGVLMVFDSLGWRGTLLAIAGVLCLPLVAALRFRETPRGGERVAGARAGFRSLARFFRRRALGGWLLVVVVFRAAETAALAMFNPMLVDRGRSLEEIGVLLGVVTAAAAFAGAVVGGATIRALGRRQTLIVSMLAVSAAVALMILPALDSTSGGWMLFACAAAVAFTGGAATAALYTNMMDACSARTAATDFTFQQSMAAGGPIVASVLSGIIATAVGYGAFFALVAIAAALTALLVARAPVPQDIQNDTD